MNDTQANNTNAKMKGSSWVVLECLAILLTLGLISFWITPKYDFGVGCVLTAVVSVLNHVLGVAAGSKMPDQASDPKIGQTSKVESTITSTPLPEVPPVAPPKV